MLFYFFYDRLSVYFPVVSYAVLHPILILLSLPCQVSSFHLDKLVDDTPFHSVAGEGSFPCCL